MKHNQLHLEFEINWKGQNVSIPAVNKILDQKLQCCILDFVSGQIKNSECKQTVYFYTFKRFYLLKSKCSTAHTQFKQSQIYLMEQTEK